MGVEWAVEGSSDLASFPEWEIRKLDAVKGPGLTPDLCNGRATIIVGKKGVGNGPMGVEEENRYLKDDIIICNTITNKYIRKAPKFNVKFFILQQI